MTREELKGWMRERALRECPAFRGLGFRESTFCMEAVLAAIEDNGFIVVPVRPTEEMRAASNSAWSVLLWNWVNMMSASPMLGEMARVALRSIGHEIGMSVLDNEKKQPQ